MSLVRPVESSSASYGESRLYMRKSSASNSNQVFRHEKQMFTYENASYCSDVDEQQCFLNSSVGPNQCVTFLSPSNSSISGPLYQPQFSSSLCPLMGSPASSINPQNPYSPCFSSVVSISQQNSGSISDSQSPDNEMGYGGDEIRSKLLELERRLLDDDDDESDSMGIDGVGIDDDWIEPMKNLLLPCSPKESSIDSKASNGDSNKETITSKQLLFYCAAAIAEDSMDEASAILSELRQMVSIQGNPTQRLTAYLVEGLAARMSCSGPGLYKVLKCKEPPSLDRLSAMQVLFEVCPCFKLGFMAANGAIIDAFKDEERVHIIDFDINQGSQYITLMQTLSTRSSTTPHLRITGVDDPESIQREIGGLKVIGKRLEKLAEQLHIPFEFKAIAAKIEDVKPAMLGCMPGEALVVNFAYQLHHMPDESVSTVNQRDHLLRMVKSLGPKLVTVVEHDVNANTAPFFPRFVEVYNYYHAVFESLDATLPRESPDRMNVEMQCLAREIVNIVACEGADRIERYEAAGKWRARMTMAGFVTYPLSSYVNKTIRAELRLYRDMYKVKEESGALYFGWENKNLVVASTWR